MNRKKMQQLVVLLLGAFVVSGCPSPTVGRLLANSGDVSQEAIAQEVVNSQAVTAEDPAEMNFDVCANVESWQRPSDEAQAKQLSNARYGEALNNGPLKRSSEQFWDHQIISFTTYGLSARMEPETLSGVWTAASDMASCYEPETTVAINQGDRAETWLLNHRISDLQWKGDRYVMTVEPAATGMQVIQFDRVDQLASLPLDVVTANGNSVEVFAGDWQ